MLKGEVRITIGGFDGFTQMMGHCYADCYRFPFSVLTLSSLLPLGNSNLFDCSRLLADFRLN